MSMEISSNYKEYRKDHSERIQEAQDRLKEARKEPDAENKNENMPALKDEYISSEQSGRKPSGLYRLGQDENGRPKVLYDAPEKSGSGDKKTEAKPDSPKDDTEKCTGSTDKADREIKRLKERKQQLEQQIQMASGDERKVRELKKKLAQTESELNQKDNDTYRRQHTVFYA